MNFKAEKGSKQEITERPGCHKVPDFLLKEAFHILMITPVLIVAQERFNYVRKEDIVTNPKNVCNTAAAFLVYVLFNNKDGHYFRPFFLE